MVKPKRTSSERREIPYRLAVQIENWYSLVLSNFSLEGLESESLLNSFRNNIYTLGGLLGISIDDYAKNEYQEAVCKALYYKTVSLAASLESYQDPNTALRAQVISSIKAFCNLFEKTSYYENELGYTPRMQLEKLEKYSAKVFTFLVYMLKEKGFSDTEGNKFVSVFLDNLEQLKPATYFNLSLHSRKRYRYYVVQEIAPTNHCDYCKDIEICQDRIKATDEVNVFFIKDCQRFINKEGYEYNDAGLLMPKVDFYGAKPFEYISKDSFNKEHTANISLGIKNDFACPLRIGLVAWNKPSFQPSPITFNLTLCDTKRLMGEGEKNYTLNSLSISSFDFAQEEMAEKETVYNNEGKSVYHKKHLAGSVLNIIKLENIKARNLSVVSGESVFLYSIEQVVEHINLEDDDADFRFSTSSIVLRKALSILYFNDDVCLANELNLQAILHNAHLKVPSFFKLIHHSFGETGKDVNVDVNRNYLRYSNLSGFYDFSFFDKNKDCWNCIYPKPWRLTDTLEQKPCMLVFPDATSINFSYVESQRQENLNATQKVIQFLNLFIIEKIDEERNGFTLKHDFSFGMLANDSISSEVAETMYNTTLNDYQVSAAQVGKNCFIKSFILSFKQLASMLPFMPTNEKIDRNIKGGWHTYLGYMPVVLPEEAYNAYRYTTDELSFNQPFI